MMKMFKSLLLLIMCICSINVNALEYDDEIWQEILDRELISKIKSNGYSSKRYYLDERHQLIRFAKQESVMYTLLKKQYREEHAVYTMATGKFEIKEGTQYVDAKSRSSSLAKILRNKIKQRRKEPNQENMDYAASDICVTNLSRWTDLGGFGNNGWLFYQGANIVGGKLIFVTLDGEVRFTINSYGSLHEKGFESSKDSNLAMWSMLPVDKQSHIFARYAIARKINFSEISRNIHKNSKSNCSKEAGELLNMDVYFAFDNLSRIRKFTKSKALARWCPSVIPSRKAEFDSLYKRLMSAQPSEVSNLANEILTSQKVPLTQGADYIASVLAQKLNQKKAKEYCEKLINQKQLDLIDVSEMSEYDVSRMNKVL